MLLSNTCNTEKKAVPNTGPVWKEKQVTMVIPFCPVCGSEMHTLSEMDSRYGMLSCVYLCSNAECGYRTA